MKETALEKLDLDHINGSLAEKADDQLRSFHIYYGLGDERTIKQLSVLTGESEHKLKSWRRRFSWERRVRALDSKVISLIDEKFGDLYSEVKGICQQVIFDLMGAAKDDIESGELKIRNIKDLETVMKMDMLLRGEATERVESKSVVVSLKQDLANMSVKQLEEILDNEGK